MRRLSLFLLSAAVWSLPLGSPIGTVLAGDCGCGGPPQVASCGCGAGHGCGCSGATCVVCPGHRCRHCIICQGGESKSGRDKGAKRNDKGGATKDASPTPVVSSMPMFMPMMLASMPVMPAMAVRAAEPEPRVTSDCNERLNRLEGDVKKLAEAMVVLQTIVGKQTDAMTKIHDDVKALTGKNP